MPDINSLPSSTRPDPTTNSSSPRLTPIPHRQSPNMHFQRRGSSRLGSFSLNDSSASNSSPVTARTSTSTSMSIPDPQHYGHGHNRQLSLGELHQALESESEATVNRLLAQINDQRAQIEHLQAQQNTSSSNEITSTAPRPRQTSSRTPSASRSRPTSMQPFPLPQAHSCPQQPYIRSASSLSRHSSYRSSRHEPSYPASPPPGAVEAGISGRERDEVGLTQAEASCVARENLLLKSRVRELERLVEEARAGRGRN